VNVLFFADIIWNRVLEGGADVEDTHNFLLIRFLSAGPTFIF
jgi:hypothetical protein